MELKCLCESVVRSITGWLWEWEWVGKQGLSVRLWGQGRFWGILCSRTCWECTAQPWAHCPRHFPNQNLRLLTSLISNLWGVAAWQISAF